MSCHAKTFRSSATASEKGELNVSVWPDGPAGPKIEIYSTRGKSLVVEGSEAISFAIWLKAYLVEPILVAEGLSE